MNKKARLEFETIILLVMSVVILVGVLYAIGVLKPEGENIVNRNACEQSVNTKAQIKLLGKSLAGNLQCKTSVVKLKNIDEEKIKEIIANEMFYCWKQFGGGKKDFLDDFDFGKSDTWCFICSRMSFDDKVKKQYDYISGFSDYLYETNIPTRNITYMEYFSGENIQTNRIPLVDKIPTSQDQYIIFLANKNADFIKNLGTGGVWGIVGSIAVAVVAYSIPGVNILVAAGTTFFLTEGFFLTTGATEYHPGLALTDSSEIVKQCSSIN